MDFESAEGQVMIRKAVAELVRQFGDQYWLDKDQPHDFSAEFYETIAEAGRLGVAAPAEGVRRAGFRYHRGVNPSRGGPQVWRWRERGQLDSCVDLWHAPVHRLWLRRPQAAQPPERIVNGDPYVFRTTAPGLDTPRITTFVHRDGDHDVVGGRMVWISKALESEKILLLAPRQSSRTPHVARYFREVRLTGITPIG